MAETPQAPRGWYDIGNGRAGLWDGTGWTGERVTHELLRTMLAPVHTNPIPPAPMSPPPPTAVAAGAVVEQSPEPNRRSGLRLVVSHVALALTAHRLSGARQRRTMIPARAS